MPASRMTRNRLRAVREAADASRQATAIATIAADKAR